MRKVSNLARMRINETTVSLMGMSNEELFHSIKNHFFHDQTLPGDKNLKDTVVAAVKEFGSEFPEDMDPYLAEHSRGETPYTKHRIVSEFANARIQQTNIAGVKEHINGIDPALFAGENIGIHEDTAAPGEVNVYKLDGMLEKTESGEVRVIGTLTNGNQCIMGTLPDNFLANNRMNVENCRADIQIADFSNGKMKNLSFDVVADTDLMSGNVLDMDFDAEKGFADAIAEMSTFREEMVEQGMA